MLLTIETLLRFLKSVGVEVKSGFKISLFIPHLPSLLYIMLMGCYRSFHYHRNFKLLSFGEEAEEDEEEVDKASQVCGL